MLFIPMNNAIVGAVFPTSGIPEFPKSTVGSVAGASTTLNLKPELVIQLQRMSPEQRNQVLATWIRQKRTQQQQQAQQQQFLQQMQMDAPGVGGGGPYTFPPNVNIDMPSTGGNMNPLGMFGAPQRPMSGGVIQTGAGGMGNVSFEMMQSFMQRNANESGNGMGMGPS
jgi:hypothetical protein